MDAMTVARTAHISYRQLDYWTRCGYVVTTGDPMPGSGVHRDYPVHEVVVAATLAQMLDAGLAMHTAAVLARDAVDLADEHGIFGLMLPHGFTFTGVLPELDLTATEGE